MAKLQKKDPGDPQSDCNTLQDAAKHCSKKMQRKNVKVAERTCHSFKYAITRYSIWKLPVYSDDMLKVHAYRNEMSKANAGTSCRVSNSGMMFLLFVTTRMIRDPYVTFMWSLWLMCEVRELCMKILTHVKFVAYAWSLLRTCEVRDLCMKYLTHAKFVACTWSLWLTRETHVLHVKFVTRIWSFGLIWGLWLVREACDLHAESVTYMWSSCIYIYTYVCICVYI